MSSEATGRPQDQGRRHRRRGTPSAATASLLADYHAAMRAELRACLGELGGAATENGLGLVPAVVVRPPLRERMALWDLAIKLGRELGSEVDATPPAGDEGPAPARARRRRVDFGGT